MTLFDRSAIPFHEILYPLWLNSAPDSLALPRDRASLMKDSTGSSNTTSETRWRRTSDVTRPTPAPTSRALTRLVSDGGADRLRNGDGTVQSSGKRSRRKRRDPSASTRGSDYRQCFSIEDRQRNEIRVTPVPYPPVVMLADVRWTEWLAIKQTKHAVIVCWLGGPVLDARVKVWNWIG